MSKIDEMISDSYFGGTKHANFSTDIASAWEVLNFLKSDCVIDLGTDRGMWVCRIARQHSGGHSESFYTAEAVTAPLAICLAALRCVGYSV